MAIDVTVSVALVLVDAAHVGPVQGLTVGQLAPETRSSSALVVVVGLGEGGGVLVPGTPMEEAARQSVRWPKLGGASGREVDLVLGAVYDVAHAVGVEHPPVMVYPRVDWSRFPELLAELHQFLGVTGLPALPVQTPRAGVKPTLGGLRQCALAPEHQHPRHLSDCPFCVQAKAGIQPLPSAVPRTPSASLSQTSTPVPNLISSASAPAARKRRAPTMVPTQPASPLVMPQVLRQSAQGRSNRGSIGSGFGASLAGGFVGLILGLVLAIILDLITPSSANLWFNQGGAVGIWLAGGLFGVVFGFWVGYRES